MRRSPSHSGPASLGATPKLFLSRTRRFAKKDGANLHLSACLIQRVFGHRVRSHGPKRAVPKSCEVARKFGQIVATERIVCNVVREIHLLILAVIEAGNGDGRWCDPMGNGKALFRRLALLLANADDDIVF